jgi:hypothetical protein
MTGTVHRRYLLGVCSDPHMIFCACSMQNGPHEYKVDHTSFYVISKLFTQTFLIGRGDVTFLHIAYVKSTKNVGKPTCVFGRFKNPFFLWLIQILKTVTMIMVTAIAFFWPFMRNPAITVNYGNTTGEVSSYCVAFSLCCSMRTRTAHCFVL